jgi:RNA polymerase sigma factor (sigma-70 family)
MDEREWLARRFEENRSHLRAVAYRMLGSLSEVDDAVQEAWLRLSHADADGIENLTGWLTTVVGRVCLDMLRSRKSRPEESFDRHLPDPVLSRDDTTDPEREALLADSIGLALLVVLETLKPAGRIAFVLHDTFAEPFDEIAAIVECSPAAARQLASRARRRIRGAAPVPDTDFSRQRRVVDAFLAASRSGDFESLLAGSTPMYFSGRIAVLKRRGKSVAPEPWPSRRRSFLVSPKLSNRCSLMVPRVLFRGCETDGRSRSWGSRSETPRSSRSTYWAIRRVCVGST